MKIRDGYIETKIGGMPGDTDLRAVYCLIERVAGKDYAGAVTLERYGYDGFDSFEVSDAGDKILIRASSGSGFAAGFNAYLRERCGYCVGALSVTGALPPVPPKVGEPICRRSRFLHRFFFNYCTFCYTYAFDGWEEWEKTLDYLILSGYNLILNPVGAESVWRSVLLGIGYTEKEADGFLCGPAFCAWQWMMNLTGWAGGAPAHWYDERRELAGRINRRLHEFGISTAVPGYAGMVPADFKKRFPDAKILDQGRWCGFDRPALLMPDDPLFARMADAYYGEYRKIPGTRESHYWSADPFHEGGITDGADLSLFGRGVYERMAAGDPKAVWLLQGWSGNPKPEMLRSVPEGRAMIVNLSADSNGGQELFGGLPWCWCSVFFFGGQYYIGGNVEKVLSDPRRCLGDERTNVVGIGYMPESVNCGGISYEAFAYSAFADDVSLEAFVRYYLDTVYGYRGERLYGAWMKMCRDILSGRKPCSGESALCARPALDVEHTSTWSGKPDPYADQSGLVGFISDMLEEYDALKDNPAYRRDLMEAARQAVANLAWYFTDRIKASYASKDAEKLSYFGGELLSLFGVQSALVSGFSDMRLGSWLEKAKRLGRTAAEKAYFEWNARVLITLWADREGAVLLRDYSAREWQGLLEDFYRPRWESFISRLEISLLTGSELAEIDHYDEELPFVYRKKEYPAPTVPDLRGAVKAALGKIASAGVEYKK